MCTLNCNSTHTKANLVRLQTVCKVHSLLLTIFSMVHHSVDFTHTLLLTIFSMVHLSVDFTHTLQYIVQGQPCQIADCVFLAQLAFNYFFNGVPLCGLYTHVAFNYFFNGAPLCGLYTHVAIHCPQHFIVQVTPSKVFPMHTL